MPAHKTLLTPEAQWQSTIRYVKRLEERRAAYGLRSIEAHRQREGGPFTALELADMRRYEDTFTNGPSLKDLQLWVTKQPHRLVMPGDVLVATWINGMNTRFGMTGVSSKGARLDGFYIALRNYNTDLVELPGDLIDKRWDHPAVGRFVADLRASSRRRVGASSPAPIPLSRVEAIPQGLCFDGCYRSRRPPRHKRTEAFRRNFLRFFPDGAVISGPSGNGGVSAWHRAHFLKGPWNTSGRVTLNGDQISFSILLKDEVVERYEGKIDGQYLRLSRHCRGNWATSREEDVYKFCPWREPEEASAPE